MAPSHIPWSKRAQEIGIRVAIGATRRDVLALVFKQGSLPVGIGLTIGLAASLAFNQVLKSQLVGVSPTDPVSLAAASAVASDATMSDAIANPNFTRANVEQVFLAVTDKALNEEGKNLIRLLLENGRLALLPIIAEQF